jgi:hypothetical protein
VWVPLKGVSYKVYITTTTAKTQQQNSLKNLVTDHLIYITNSRIKFFKAAWRKFISPYFSRLHGNEPLFQHDLQQMAAQ